MVKEMRQYEVYWISLDPARGSEMTKTRPCVIVSPDEMNLHLKTVIIIPVTSTVKSYPWRINCLISGKEGSMATDQIRAIDKNRIGNKLGILSKSESEALKDVLKKMFVD